MAFATYSTNKQRKRCSCVIFAHVSRHHLIEATDRGGCSEGIKQIRSTGSIGDTKSIGVGTTILIAPSNNQIRDFQTIESWTCKSRMLIAPT